MTRARYWLAGLVLALVAAAGILPARAVDFTVNAYADFRAVAAPTETDWLKGGLSKFRYDGTHFRFAEAVAQGDLSLDNTLDVIAVVRAEPDQRSGLDALEAYAYWHTPADERGVSWSVKAGAFFPTISLENDDLGWASPYTLTPSAINSWIGEELRTIGSEGIMKVHTDDAGTISLTGAVFCCNDPTGILLADRGWAMDDRPTGLFERVRKPDSSLKIFHQPFPGRTGEFEEIDGRWGWYGGLTWQMDGIGKITALRYNNQADPAAFTSRDTGWETAFWAIGARTQIKDLLLIAQQLTGYTAISFRGIESITKFQSAYLLASYDIDSVWRVSLRGDVFQTRHPTSAQPSVMSEDGRALTAAVSWSGYDWLRLTGEVVAMDSRKLQYPLAGFSGTDVGQSQFQLSARVFY